MPASSKTPSVEPLVASPVESDKLVIRNASEHNLKNVSLSIPRHIFAVITGISGSGKSSLAFDTIFKEGQRRYMASLSAYARQFVQSMERPNVDLIEGLSPTISIDQKTAGRNPRSTVGTVTEIYDFLRLLFSRLGVPHCPKGHGPIQGQTPEMIVDHIARDYDGEYILLMAPVVRERKGEYRKELDDIEAKGFLRVRVDGKVIRLDDAEARKGLDLARYEKHTIEIVLDRLRVNVENRTRLDDSVTKALALAEGVCTVALAERENVDPVPFAAPKVELATVPKREIKKNPAETEMHAIRDADKRVRYRVFNTASSCATCGFSVPELEPRLFSFNVPQGACPECSGLGQKQEFHPSALVKDPSVAIFEGALGALNPDGNILYMGSGRNEISKIFKAWKQNIKTPWQDLPEKLRLRVLKGEGKEKDGVAFDIISSLTWLYEKYRIGHLEKFFHIYGCPTCKGLRLNEVARNVLFRGQTISELSDLAIKDLSEKITTVKWEETEKPVALPILREIRERLSFLVNVGLDYLTLSRRANTLSGGEAQRIRLASQVGSGLEGCLYVLDEPSIGLHQSDNKKLIQTLKNLRDKSNTVYVIEHDEETMLSADHLVDVGPEAGVHGGEIMWNGPPLELLDNEKIKSFTRDYLLGKKIIPIPEKRRKIEKDGRALILHGGRRHNLKDLTVRFPLGVFTCVTGVSGSGKSTLVLDLLKDGIEKKLNEPYVRDKEEEKKKLSAKEKKEKFFVQKKVNAKGGAGSEFDLIEGIEHIDKIIEIDQKPIGRTPRSNPATYTSAMDIIRDLFSMVPESKVRGYEKGRFSFNVKGGRCETCGGAGVVEVDMQLFSTAEVICEDCDGKRFNANTLDIHYKGKNIFQVLDLTLEEASEFFKDIPKLNRVLAMLCELGMGYVKLGQPSTTLSGGEAQRIKLATELGKRATGRTLYVLDEPTTGLHFEDIRKLLSALHSLVEAGNTVIVIEHNLDVILSADHLMELGPGGGGEGGHMIAEGVPESVAASKTPTGVELKGFLDRQKKRASGHYLKKNHTELVESILQDNRSAKVRNADKGTGPLPKAGLDSDPWSEGVKLAPLFKAGRIILRGVRKHNLKNVSLDLPKNKIITVTGLSGSGKTSLAFETLFQEGQRKYIESLSTYARRFLGRIPRAEADRIEGISPTIAVDQKAGSRNPRSTLATTTEIHDSFRVLFANIGKQHCPHCGKPLQKQGPAEVAKVLLQECPGETCLFLAPLFDATSTHRSILESSDKIISYIPVLQEKGYLRIWVDGKISRLDESGLAETLSQKLKNKKQGIQKIFLVLDRFAVSEKERSRIIETTEKSYEIGEDVMAVLDGKEKLRQFAGHAACFDHDFHFTDTLTTRHFSFNHHLGACARCQGIGLARAFNEKKFIADEEAPLLRGAMYKGVAPFFTRRGQFYGAALKSAARRANIDAWTMPWRLLDSDQKLFILRGSKAANSVKVEYEAYAQKEWKGIAAIVEDLYTRTESEKFGPAFAHLIDFHTCPECQGGRLSKALLAVKIDGQSIHQISQMNARDCAAFFKSLEKKLPTREKMMAKEVLEEIEFRLTHLLYLGLHYLSLDRTMGTLSGGESQRVRLSTQIGNKLKDVIYVLDEPTIGLHERETEQLLEAIENLRDRGNTVVMVEHDGRVIKSSDWIVDIGPGAGAKGGELRYSGPWDLANAKMQGASFFKYLSGENQKLSTIYRSLRKGYDWKKDSFLLLSDLKENNLKDIEVRIPLGSLVALSGVSGSGKSSLMNYFYPRAKEAAEKSKFSASSKIALIENGKASTRNPFSRVDYVDQSPVSTSQRSTSASYMDIYDLIRDVFSKCREAKARGYERGHFSFNSSKGQCPQCQGAGVEEIEMHFISDVTVVCESCKGARYRREVLEVFYKGKNIAEILALTYREAWDFFDGLEKIREKIQFLLDAGLGYLKLGMNTNILSGGELQRLKIARELSTARDTGGNLYLLDEPTTGLHFADTELLVKTLDRLVSRGNTVVVIEHNIEFLRNCDYLIDLGPEGGNEGGHLVAEGTPEEIKAGKKGYTWKYL